MELRTGFGNNQPNKFLEELLFPNGLPKKLEYEKIVSKEIEVKIYGEDKRITKTSYPFSRSEVTKERIKSHINPLSKKEKESFMIALSYLFNSRPNKEDEYQKTVIFIDKNLMYSLFPDTMEALTLEEIYFIFDDRPNKMFLRSIVNQLNLNGTERSFLMKNIKQNKFDLFRILGKQGIQFNKQELKEIVSLPSFSLVTTSGTMGSSDTADIINRRAVIVHQSACDDEIFFDVLNTIKDSNTKESFVKTLRKKSLREKFKNYPSVLVWLELQ
jgi:hypothetical protein